MRRRLTYRVVGWEQVTLPAGTFRALKIEAEGTWTATLAPANTAVIGSWSDAQGTIPLAQTRRTGETSVTGRMGKAFWVRARATALGALRRGELRREGFAWGDGEGRPGVLSPGTLTLPETACPSASYIPRRANRGSR